MTKEELRLEALKLSLEYVTYKKMATNVYYSEQAVIDYAKTSMDFIEGKQ